MKKCLRNQTCNCKSCKSEKKFMVNAIEIVNSHTKEEIIFVIETLRNNGFGKKYPRTTEEYKNNYTLNLWCAAWLHKNNEL